MNNATTYPMPQTKSLSDYIEILRRNINMALVVSVSILVATLVIVFVWPPAYRSSATILIEQQEIPPDLVRSTVSTYADQRIQIINQRVMTRTNLEEIIKKYGLYSKTRRNEPMEVVVEKMRDDIHLKTISANVVDPRNGRPTQATIAFKLSYESESPQLAQKVANELTTLFLNENLSSRREMASQASDFLTTEANQVSNQISKLEKQLANFKERNLDSMPDLVQYNMQLAERTDREMMNVDQDLRSLKERRIYLQSRLAQINPSGALYSENGEHVLGPLERLKTLRAKYISLSAVYAPDHPDLIRMRKEITSLESEVGKVGSTAKELESSLTAAKGELAADRKRYGDSHPTVQRLENQVDALEKALNKQRQSDVNTTLINDADNPAYIQIQAQLQTVEAKMDSLQKKKTDLKAKLSNIDKRVAETPLVEQKYRKLTRDYDNAWAKYKELKAKQAEAKLAQSLEMERKGERFTLIDPPLLPERPASPNRTAIVLLGIVLSIVGGFSAVVIRDSVDGTVSNARVVTTLIEMPPLVSIPYIVTEVEKGRRRFVRVLAIVLMMSVIGAAAVAVNYFYKPLDIIWYLLLRKLGIF